MSVYNGENHLKESVESILNQTFCDFEFIIIDDGSSDNSVQILNEYVKKDSRCSLIARENKGLVASRNQLLKLVNTDFVANMDQDDISESDRLEIQYQFLVTNPDCVAVSSDAQLIDAEGLPIKIMWRLYTHEEIDNKNIYANGSHICDPGTMFRQSALLQIGGYRSEYNYAEDYDLFLRIAEIGKLASISRPLIRYRQHLTSVGYLKQHEQISATIRAREDALLRRNIPYSVTDLYEKLEDFVPATHEAIHLKWAWWALSDRNYITSLKHARKAFLLNPINFEPIRISLVVLKVLAKLKI